MVSADQLADMLWHPFLSQIQTGDPVFFCFHKEMISDIFREFSIPADHPADIVNAAARSLISIDGEDVEIDPKTFELTSSGFSLAIILACQQILVVEEMVREPRGFSEHAYFPRLRAKISEDLPQRSLNPFSFEDFEQIWRQLAKEIRSIKGSEERSVTFTFGIETGINKARSFPLSQALLSHDDLFTIVRKIGFKRAKEMTHEHLWKSLRQERFILQRRAQRLLALPNLRDRVIEQLKSFLRTVDPKKFTALPSEIVSGEPYNLGFFKEPLDWQNEEYRVFLSSKASAQRILDESQIAKELDDILRRKGFIILPSDQIGDIWVKRRQLDAIEPGSVFLIVGSPIEIKRAVGIIRTIWPTFPEGQREQYNLGGRTQEVVTEALWPISMPDPLWIYDGSLSKDRRAFSQNSHEWIGGVCVDNRSQRYLKQYLPEKIRFGSVEFSLLEARRVNGRLIGIENVLSHLDEIAGRAPLELEFPNGATAKLAVAGPSHEDQDRMGLQMLESGRLSPVLDRIQSGAMVLTGFELPKGAIKPFSRIQVAFLLDGVSKKGSQPLDPNQMSEIEMKIRGAYAPLEVRNYLIQALRIRPQLDPEILEKLEILI